MNSTDRQIGFYWVKYQNEWIVAQWYREQYGDEHGSWFIPGDEHAHDDAILDDINEKEINPYCR